MRSRQKIQWAKWKDKSRKALERSRINSTDFQKDYSTPHVQKHRALKVKIDFTKTCKLTSRKEKSMKKTLENAVYKMSSSEKKAELINSVIDMQSPNSRSEIRKTVTNNTACSPIKSALKSISKSWKLQHNLAKKVLLSTYLVHRFTKTCRKTRKSLGISWSSYKSGRERTVKLKSKPEYQSSNKATNFRFL